MRRKRVILDMDPGIDDALALILALRSPELKVEAVTVVFGNAPVELCARNAAYILSLMCPDEKPILAMGEAAPLKRARISAPEVHGEDGLGNIFKSPERACPSSPDELGYALCKVSAPQLMVSLLRENPGELTIIATGPLTNLAKGISLDRAAFLEAAEIISMGGAFSTPGNTTPKAEFNYFCDPHAASAVFELGANLRIVPLDVTQKVKLMRGHLRKGPWDKKDKLVSFIVESSDFLMAHHRRRAGFDGCYLHDPLAVGVAVDESLVGLTEGTFQIVTEEGPNLGQTIAHATKERGVVGRLCSEVDADRFLHLFLKRSLGI